MSDSCPGWIDGNNPDDWAKRYGTTHSLSCMEPDFKFAPNSDYNSNVAASIVNKPYENAQRVLRDARVHHRAVLAGFSLVGTAILVTTGLHLTMDLNFQTEGITRTRETMCTILLLMQAPRTD